ncbi:LysR family transcriptional regulator [Secundilactobacillus similis]|uniref:LysR family transcriptional regulator n=1 Tax=Secundilactobacillus similis TaxID=414682 RepID=UPI0006D1FC17|nr:LysR family transcriptional regulator [Secundilactobacillus similis]
MNLHQLRIFYTVAQLGSMTAAAKQLYISQPAVTKQVHLLEENYGVTLVERSGRGIKLTALAKPYTNKRVNCSIRLAPSNAYCKVATLQSELVAPKSLSAG